MNITTLFLIISIASICLAGALAICLTHSHYEVLRLRRRIEDLSDELGECDAYRERYGASLLAIDRLANVAIAPETIEE